MKRDYLFLDLLVSFLRLVGGISLIAGGGVFVLSLTSDFEPLLAAGVVVGCLALGLVFWASAAVLALAVDGVRHLRTLVDLNRY